MTIPAELHHAVMTLRPEDRRNRAMPQQRGRWVFNADYLATSHLWFAR
jgi:hypothetical protein